MPYYNYKKVFSFRKICFFIRESMRNFCFSISESSLLKYKTFFTPEAREFHFLKYKKLFPGFSFLEYKKRFLLRKYKEFFGGFHFLKYKKLSWGEFCLFFELGLKSATGSPIIYYYKEERTPSKTNCLGYMMQSKIISNSFDYTFC